MLQFTAADVAILYLVLGLAGVLPLVLLTPPFQVPDEPQHFFRAYQISELSLRGVVRDGTAGAFLPSSLPELVDRFLGTRANLAPRPVLPNPLNDTLRALAIPLEPARQSFVDFSGAAFYSPLPYLPQVAAIIAGRSIGLGPLGLLYAARLVNGIAAVLVLAVALRSLPAGNTAMLVMGLLPMMLFQFASASPDAMVISMAFLFAAIAMRARFHGHWQRSEILSACVAGTVFCSLKPVYAPLLLMGLTGALRRGSARHIIFVHIVLILTTMMVTILWISYSAPSFVLQRQGTSVSQQLAGILSHPGTFGEIVLSTLRTQASDWARGTIGILGWLTIWLPDIMYALPVAALLLCLPLPCPVTARLGMVDVLWQASLCCVSTFLVVLAVYLYWTPVGASTVEGVQGRYFLPLIGPVLTALCATMPRLPSVFGLLLMPTVLLMVATEALMTSLCIVYQYRVF